MQIVFENVSFSYDHNKEVINNLSFSINIGEVTSIIGPNGSGKSTIAKLIMGLLEPDSGHIYIDGVLLDQNTAPKLRNNMGIIFQNPDNQFVGATVLDDIAFGLENRKTPRGLMQEKIKEVVKLVRMEDFLDKNPEQLSGGQKQRVAIAGVLVTNPDIIIFDEATSMLDPIGTKEIGETLNMLKKEGNKTIITITHNLEEILYSDRVVLIDEGRIQTIGTPKEILANNELLTKAGFDTLDTVKLIKELGEDNKELIQELWELTFKM